MQPLVVELLAAVPVAKTGAWLTAGWSDAVSEAKPKADYIALLKKWGEQQENTELRNAAKRSPMLNG